MVLAGSHHRHVFAVTHGDEAGLLALQKLLNHHTCAAFVVRHAQHVLVGAGGQHEFDGLMRLVQRHRHHHALACSQAIGLDHDGRAFFVHIGMGCHRVGEGFVLCRRNAMALHEGFGKGL